MAMAWSAWCGWLGGEVTVYIQSAVVGLQRESQIYASDREESHPSGGNAPGIAGRRAPAVAARYAPPLHHQDDIH